jgi:hypothetical protein
MNTIVWLCTSAKCIYVCDYRVVSVKDTYIYKTTVEMTIILLTICRRGRSFPQPPIEPQNKTVGPNDTLGPAQRPIWDVDYLGCSALKPLTQFLGLRVILNRGKNECKNIRIIIIIINIYIEKPIIYIFILY